jgi:Polyketide cyclase / dehydrase and lipid transport
MKHLDGRASSVVSAPLVTCFAVLAAVDRYPSWSEFVREVVAVEHDDHGRPSRAHVVVEVPRSPFGKRFEFDVAIRTAPLRSVHVTRLPNTPVDADQLSLSWSLFEDRGTRVVLEFSASASFLPGLVPLPGVGDLIAGTLLKDAAPRLGAAIAPAGRGACTQ